MSQSLLISHPGRTSLRSHCLLQYVHIGFRFMRYQCAPWLVLAITPIKLLSTSEVQRTRERIRYMRAITRIDFVSIYGLLHDLLW